MTTLSIRSDDYSVQVISTASKRFFVRIADPHLVKDVTIFSDFRIDEGDAGIALEALQLLAKQAPEIYRARKWVVSDLLPTPDQSVSAEHPELVRRFDELKSLFRSNSEGTRRLMENAYIEPRADKFDGVFLFAD